MDANVVALLTGIISPLATLAAGFGGVRWASHLTQRSLREQREEERKVIANSLEDARRRLAEERYLERRCTRTLLHLEAQHNLVALCGLKDQLFCGVSGEEPVLQPQVRFMEATLPTWGHVVFDSTIIRLPDALTPDAIAALYLLYANLNRLDDLHDALVAAAPLRLASEFKAFLAENALQQGQDTSTSIKAWARYPELERFKADSRPDWQECFDIIQGLTIAGNPVPEV